MFTVSGAAGCRESAQAVQGAAPSPSQQSLSAPAASVDVKPVAPVDSGVADARSPDSAASSATATVTTAAEAAKRAVGPANAALDAALARRPATSRPTHDGPWVTEASAKVTGDPAHGFRVAWSHAPPAGLEYHVTVLVDQAARTRVETAKVSYASK